MVQHQRLYFHQLRKGEAEQLLDFAESHHLDDHLLCGSKKTARPTLRLLLLLLFSLISCSLVFAPRLLFLDPFPFISSTIGQESSEQSNAPACSAMENNTICCDRTSSRSDVCYMRGDVRTHSASNSILLRSPSNSTAPEEKIKPYTRKWEASVMATIDELRLRTDAGPAAHCDLRHDVPAVVFSTGGYTGNVYHEFNDGILPLYITAQQYNKKVVFVLLEYHDWWITKYQDVLSRLSDYPPVDFSNDPRTYCFPEAVVGLRIHDELTVDPSRMANNKTIRDFRRFLDEAYQPRVRWVEREEEQQGIKRERRPAENPAKPKPKLVIVSRNGSRAIENEAEVAKAAEEVGFRVAVLRPGSTMELAKIYRALNACDAMVGVHGAAMTHFLFMRPGAVFVQVVPLGTDWAADAYYGVPARKMGLRYIGYKILPRESSLFRKYASDDPVLRDPDRVNAKGWDFTKKVYLDGQNVRLDLGRFRKRLARAYDYLVSKQQQRDR